MLPVGRCLGSLLKKMLKAASLEVSKHKDVIPFSSKFIDL